ncbi:MAG: hypothetical protein FJX95_08180 [Bacteroidetes bacterium]|nr:hypothetical protein [Bacteroidota bacterium]
MGLGLAMAQPIFSQNALSANVEDAQKMAFYIDACHDSLAVSTDDAKSIQWSNVMEEKLLEMAAISADKNVFLGDYAFWKFSKIISPDQRFRLITWNVPLQNGEHIYFGVIWIWSEMEGRFFAIPLKDFQRDGDKWDARYFEADQWPGALYYEIIPCKSKRKKEVDTYTLLGWDGRDNMTNAKVLDVVKIISNEKVRFGEGLFETPTGTKKRLMFQYADEVSASFKYYPKKKAIVMDHLSPKNAMMEGIYADYGPDGTYDLYQWEKGKWKLYSNIDISVFSSSDTKMYRPPKR